MDYFEFISKELLLKLGQVKEFIKAHNPTIGVVTEEILRSFLKEHLPKYVSVAQGFIRNASGETSRQCDIIIYDAIHYAPFYRINDIVIVPEESVIAFVEVKTTINSSIFQDALDYFKVQKQIFYKPAYLFIYNSDEVSSISRFFDAYKLKNGPHTYDHDTYQYLPNEITGINSSYHLKQDYVIGDRDTLGYSTYYYQNEEGTAINALQHFYLSIYEKVEQYIVATGKTDYHNTRADYFKKDFNSYLAFSLFDI